MVSSEVAALSTASSYQTSPAAAITSTGGVSTIENRPDAATVVVPVRGKPNAVPLVDASWNCTRHTRAPVNA